MTTLKPEDVALYAQLAGFKGKYATRAVAVALAESGGNTAAVNVNRDKWHSRDRGLWQINNHWHPEVSDGAAFDPKQAAAAAFKISKGGTDWHEWATWPAAASAEWGRAKLAVAATSNAATFLTTGHADGGGITLNPFDAGHVDIPNPVADVGHAVGQIAVVVTHAGAWMADPHNWVRIVEVVAGTGGVLVALYLLAQSGAAGSTAQGAARTTKTAGKAAGLAALA